WDLAELLRGELHGEALRVSRGRHEGLRLPDVPLALGHTTRQPERRRAGGVVAKICLATKERLDTSRAFERRGNCSPHDMVGDRLVIVTLDRHFTMQSTACFDELYGWALDDGAICELRNIR